VAPRGAGLHHSPAWYSLHNWCPTPPRPGQVKSAGVSAVPKIDVEGSRCYHHSKVGQPIPLSSAHRWGRVRLDPKKQSSEPACCTTIPRMKINRTSTVNEASHSLDGWTSTGSLNRLSLTPSLRRCVLFFCTGQLRQNFGIWFEPKQTCKESLFILSTFGTRGT